MCCLKAPPGEGGTVKSLVMLSSGRSSIHRNWWNRIRCFDSGFQWSDHWRAHPSLPGNRFSSPIELQVPAERESGFPPSWFKPLCRFWFVFLRCDPGVFSSHDRFNFGARQFSRNYPRICVASLNYDRNIAIYDHASSGRCDRCFRSLQYPFGRWPSLALI